MGLALSAYADALKFLYERTTGPWRLGLERTEALLGALGDPHRRLRVLHVAGTNGKGSVCATLEAVLRARGLHVAKYTSPHLVDFRERFVVDGREVAEEQVVEFIERWTPTIERLGATFFEATTAMAFDLFARAAVDVAVVEVGLGGRLDATNVVLPVVAGVTSIGIDHTEYLGDSREAIAREKGGVFKRGAAAVVGEGDPATRALLARVAREVGASQVVVVAERYELRLESVDAEGTAFTLRTEEGPLRLATPLVGEHQAHNATTALVMARVAGPPFAPAWEEAAAALATVSLPGRFQRAGSVIFDVAHNPDGAATLAGTLGLVRPPRPRVAVLCVLADKDWPRMVERLASEVDHFVMTDAPTAPESRRWRPDDAARFARERGWSAECEPDFDRALGRAVDGGSTVVVTGSFHTVGDAMTRLQVSPLSR